MHNNSSTTKVTSNLIDINADYEDHKREDS